MRMKIKKKMEKYYKDRFIGNKGALTMYYASRRLFSRRPQMSRKLAYYKTAAGGKKSSKYTKKKPIVHRRKKNVKAKSKNLK